MRRIKYELVNFIIEDFLRTLRHVVFIKIKVCLISQNTNHNTTKFEYTGFRLGLMLVLGLKTFSASTELPQNITPYRAGLDRRDIGL